jgi:hypothetical protein
LPTANVTAAAIFRVVEKCRPTLLVDEADTFLSGAEELRGIINSGHRQGGAVIRTVGDDHEPRSFSTFGAVAIALIGKLPATVQDRSVTIDLKRRLKTEKVTSFRSDRTSHLDVLARKAARWAADNADRVKDADPEMAAGLFNRDADNWRPLLALAAVAAGDWPERARQIAERCCAAAAEGEEARLPILLADIKATFAERKTERLASLDLVEALKAIEGGAWAEMGARAKPLTQNALARLLKPLGITTENLRDAGQVFKGYHLHGFQEAFSRYLDPLGAFQPLQRYNADEMGTSDTFPTATAYPNVADENYRKPNNDGHCSGAADEIGISGEESVFGGQNGDLDRRAEALTTVCVHCGEPGRTGDPIQECFVDDGRCLLHINCQREWLDGSERTTGRRPAQ